MGFESFYGGRQGASFVIVKRFDGLNAPQGSQGEAEVVYRNKEYAVTSNQEYFLYEGEQGEEHLIEKNSENYKTYTWKIQNLDRSEVSAVPASDPSGEVKDIQLSEEKAEYMVPCFSKGGDTVDQVNYGEYVIIDTIFGLHERSNPNNGKVYRRGMNFNGELGGAEYIGQIVGPRGETTEVDLSSYTSVLEEQGATEGQWDVSDGLVPGKYIDETTGELAFNDDIKYSWVNIRDSYGNVESVLIGFQFPYLVQDFVAESRSPYYQLGDDIPEGKVIGDLLENNFNLVERDDEGDHPFYEKWKIHVPKGIKGDSIVSLETYQIQVLKKNIQLYNDSDFTSPYTVTNDFIPIKEITENYYSVELEDTIKYAHKIQDNEDTSKMVLKLGYKKIDFDEKEDGIESDIIDIDEYNTIDSIVIDENGKVKINYSYDDPDEFQLKTITNTQINTTRKSDGTEGREGDGSQKLEIQYNGEIEGDNPKWNAIGNPINYILDTYVVPFDDANANYRGHLLIYYSDPTRRGHLTDNQKYHSNRLNKDTDEWVDMGYVRGEQGGVRIFARYNDESSLYNEGVPIPPEELGVNIGTDVNHAGWVVATGSEEESAKTLWAYDYFKPRDPEDSSAGYGDWFSLGEMEVTSDPRNYIALSGDTLDLKNNGFVVDITTVRSAVEREEV